MPAVVKWSLRLLLAVSGLAVLYVAPLVFPAPLFAHEARFGDYRVYSDAPLPADFARVIEETTKRVEAMEHTSRRASPRVFLCDSPERYAFFAFLTRMSPQSLAINLSVANEMFVSMDRVREFAARNRGRFRHTRFEGNLAEVMAHEIAHFNSVDALGYRTHLAQPVWKSEGWAEYQANIAAIRDDPAYDLGQRIDQLLDDRNWAAGRGLARDLWEWQLLVEYLGEVEGYRLADLSRDEVTKLAVRRRMLAWHRDQRKVGERRVEPEPATPLNAARRPDEDQGAA